MLPNLTAKQFHNRCFFSLKHTKTEQKQQQGLVLKTNELELLVTSVEKSKDEIKGVCYEIALSVNKFHPLKFHRLCKSNKRGAIQIKQVS